MKYSLRSLVILVGFIACLLGIIRLQQAEPRSLVIRVFDHRGKELAGFSVYCNERYVGNTPLKLTERRLRQIGMEPKGEWRGRRSDVESGTTMRELMSKDGTPAVLWISSKATTDGRFRSTKGPWGDAFIVASRMNWLVASAESEPKLQLDFLDFDLQPADGT